MTTPPSRRRPSRRRVLLIHTGGTIGMKRTREGYAPAAGYLAERLAQMPELADPQLPQVELLEHDPLLDSADMQPPDWQRIADTVAEHDADFDGFVILHGTDTMAYSASALSFLLEGLAKPVIFTGSQIPLAEVRSDARENLITSLLLAARDDLFEVALYMNGLLLRGNRCTKVSASGFDAFDSPNFPPLGRIGVDIRLRHELLRPPDSGPLQVRSLADVSVAALRLFPGIRGEAVRNLLREPVAGLVLESYGAGNAPRSNRPLLEALAEATARGVVVVNCSQCLRGRVDMHGYATGHALAAIGVVGGGDMTPEAALTKLLYLLSCDLSPDEVRAAMAQDLRGEYSHEAAS